MALLTIGVPVYNAMPFLMATIDSLLRQTDPRFELLIIDDGSSDNSYDYLRSIKDPRIRLLSQNNMGLSTTLNRMLHEVNTPWLVRHDADDIAYPDRIKLTAEYVDKHPEAGMLYSHATYYHNGRHFSKFRTTIGSPAFLRSLTHAGYLLSICHPSVVLNVDKTLSIGGYRFNRFIEDIDLWWRMALRYDIILISDFTVSVRHNMTSVSHLNLHHQVINTLYIQYLLLSHLQGYDPLPYNRISTLLAGMVDTRHLRFRATMRRATAYAGNNNYCLALLYALKAFCVSPFHFYKRLLYEFGHTTFATNGVDPKLFNNRKSLLWPI